jgi:hypothetical protein
MRKLLPTCLFFFAFECLALVPKANLPAEEMYEKAYAVVVIQLQSGEFNPGIGDGYTLCGKVKATFKGQTEKNICIEDGDDYGTECFERSLGRHYIAFLKKTRFGYTALWTRDSVFLVHGGGALEKTEEWEAGKCNVEPQPFQDCVIGKACPVPEHINVRTSRIFEHALNKSQQLKAKTKKRLN